MFLFKKLYKLLCTNSAGKLRLLTRLIFTFDPSIMKRYLLVFILFAVFTSCSRRVTESGVASYYSDNLEGRKTANGEIFHQSDYVAAHKTLPFGTKVSVKNLSNGKTVKVRINDRGPFIKGRIIDLSRKAAKKIDMENAGITKVTIQYKRKKNK